MDPKISQFGDEEVMSSYHGLSGNNDESHSDTKIAHHHDTNPEREFHSSNEYHPSNDQEHFEMKPEMSDQKPMSSFANPLDSKDIVHSHATLQHQFITDAVSSHDMESDLKSAQGSDDKFEIGNQEPLSSYIVQTGYFPAGNNDSVYPLKIKECMDMKPNMDGCNLDCDQGIFKIQCSVCEAQYDSITEYTHHLNMHLQDSDKCKEKVPDILSEHSKYDHDAWQDPKVHNNTESHGSLTRGTKEYLDESNAGHKQKPFSCTLCEISCSSKLALTRHIIAVHNKLRPFTCKLCDRSFTKNGHLTIHVNAVHRKLKPFSCTLCEKSFARKGVLNNHILEVHHRVKRVRARIPCTLCEKSFADKKVMATHVNAVHYKLKPFSCTLCEKSFGEKVNLTRHIKVHYKVKTDQSGGGKMGFVDSSSSHIQSQQNSECGSKIKSQLYHNSQIDCEETVSNSKLHVLVDQHHLQKLEPLPGTSCQKVFEYKEDLTNTDNEQETDKSKEKMCDTSEQWSNDSLTNASQGSSGDLYACHKRKLFTCTLCDKSFSCKAYLTRHVKFVHEKLKPFPCTLCNKSFAYDSDLSRHVKRIHEKLKPFSCTLCNKSFGYKNILSKHVKQVHQKQTLFSCTFCERSFSQKVSLTGHINAVHKKLKPFSCTLCDKSFGYSSVLSKHIKEFHEKLSSSGTILQDLSKNIDADKKLKNLSCTLCDKSFDCDRDLSQHIDIEHGLFMSCPLCGESFALRENLTSHIAAHEGKH